MKADRVEVSRDDKGWLIRIQVGAEVIRRHCKSPKDSDEASVRNSAVETASEEGYTVDPADIVFV